MWPIPSIVSIALMRPWKKSSQPLHTAWRRKLCCWMSRQKIPSSLGIPSGVQGDFMLISWFYCDFIVISWFLFVIYLWWFPCDFMVISWFYADFLVILCFFHDFMVISLWCVVSDFILWYVTGIVWWFHGDFRVA